MKRSQEHRLLVMVGMCVALANPLVGAFSAEADQLNQSVSNWIQALKSTEVQLRRQAASALPDADENARAMVPALVEALHDEDAEVRHRAAMAIGRCGEERDFPRLLESLKTESVDYRVAVIEAIGDLGGSAIRHSDSFERKIPIMPVSVLDVLVVAVQDREPRISKGGVKALATIGHTAKTAAPELVGLLGEPNIRGLAALALHDILGREASSLAPPEVLFASLIETLKDEEPEVRRQAARVIGEWREMLVIGGPSNAAVPANRATPDVVSPLIGALNDADPRVRPAAAMTLGQIGPAAGAAVPSLLRMMVEDWQDEHNAAAGALSRMGSDVTLRAAGVLAETAVLATLPTNFEARLPGILRILGPHAAQVVVARAGKALTDSDPKMRVRAACILVLEGPAAKPLIPLLIRRLARGSSQDRFYAAMILGSIGREAKDSVGALITATKDKDPQVRLQSLASLEKIGPVGND